MLGGSVGSLFASAGQTSEEFDSFHWQAITIFIGEFLVWEPISCLGQVIFCSLIVKLSLSKRFVKFLANPIVLRWIDGHGLEQGDER